MVNDMEARVNQQWKMTWKLGLHRGLWGLGFPKIRGTFLEGP